MDLPGAVIAWLEGACGKDIIILFCRWQGWAIIVGFMAAKIVIS